MRRKEVLIEDSRGRNVALVGNFPFMAKLRSSVGQLLQDLTAIALIIQHALHAALLAFDPAQALHQFLLDILILDLHF